MLVDVFGREVLDDDRWLGPHPGFERPEDEDVIDLVGGVGARPFSRLLHVADE